MKTGIKTIIALMAIMLLACSNNKENEIGTVAALANDISRSEMTENKPAGEAKEVGAVATGGSTIPVMERKLIKNGDVSFKTKSLTETKSRIKAELLSVNGYIAKENVFDFSQNPSEELTVRVPAKDFDKFLEKILEGAVEIDSKHIDIQDVSEEFVDIEARLKNKKQLESKYQELLVKATNMDDILRIEKEISYIREEIESTEGRLRYLSNQVGYSTLRINYYEHRASGFNFGSKLGNAFKNGSTGFLWFLIFMVQMWPLWLIGGLVWWFIVWLVRRNRK